MQHIKIAAVLATAATAAFAQPGANALGSADFAGVERQAAYNPVTQISDGQIQAPTGVAPSAAPVPVSNSTINATVSASPTPTAAPTYAGAAPAVLLRDVAFGAVALVAGLGFCLL